MKDIRMILPNPASDTAGAASLLFQLDGLSIIHDAAGSMESYITFDESRELEGKRTVASRLSRLEDITGDDRILLDKIEQECAAWQARQMVSEAEVVRTSTLENALEDAKKESERIMNEAKNYDAKVKAEAEEIVNMTLTERRQELENARKELEDSREGVLEEARKEGEKMLEAVRKEAEELRQRLDEEIENYRKAREAELKESLKEAQQIAQATLEEKTRDALQLYADTVHKTEEMANLIVAIYEQQMEVIQQDRKDISAIVEKLERQNVNQGLQRSRR